MGTTQLLLVVGSLILLGMLALMVGRTFTTSAGWDSANQALITGTAIAQSMLEETQLRAFDEKTVNASVKLADSLTSPVNFGPEAGETTSSTFDDISDYNGYIRSDTLEGLGVFTTSVAVHYVPTMYGETISWSKTFCKRIDVCTYNKYLADTIKLSYISTY